MSNRSPCPHCGLGPHLGPHPTTPTVQCINALKSHHRHYRQRVMLEIQDKLQEVHNNIGGVIGYRIELNADETEKLCKLVELR